MSKLNLTFRGKTYSIDKSLVSGAISSLETVLIGLGGSESENDSPSCLVVVVNNSIDAFDVTTKRLVENNEVEDDTDVVCGYGEYAFFYDTQKGSVAILRTTLPCIVRDGDNYDIVYNNGEYVEVDEANQMTYVTIPMDSATVEIVVGE